MDRPRLKSSIQNPAFISLFSGAGGLDIGLEQAGWQCMYASDLDSAAVATLEANRGRRIARGRYAFSNAIIEQADIQLLSAPQILAKAGIARGEALLLAGGPPCQSWSSAGHQHGFADPRGRLFDDFARLANGLGVRWLLLENVRGLLTARGPDGRPGSALAYIRGELLKAGFQTTVGLLNAADYGVGQRRVRLFIFGFRSGDAPPFPLATHAKTIDFATPEKKPWVTLGEVLSKIPKISESDIIRPTALLADELAAVDPGHGVKSPGKQERTRPGGHWGYKQGAFVADLCQSARTVTASAQQDWIRDPKIGLRRLCPTECAAIQSFPSTWFFFGARMTQYRLIGNAVPPLLAQTIGAALMRHLRKGTSEFVDAYFDKLLPLPKQLTSAINYTVREEKSNGESRRTIPSRRASRILDNEVGGH